MGLAFPELAQPNKTILPWFDSLLEQRPAKLYNNVTDENNFSLPVVSSDYDVTQEVQKKSNCNTYFSSSATTASSSSAIHPVLIVQNSSLKGNITNVTEGVRPTRVGNENDFVSPAMLTNIIDTPRRSDGIQMTAETTIIEHVPLMSNAMESNVEYTTIGNRQGMTSSYAQSSQDISVGSSDPYSEDRLISHGVHATDILNDDIIKIDDFVSFSNYTDNNNTMKIFNSPSVNGMVRTLLSYWNYQYGALSPKEKSHLFHTKHLISANQQIQPTNGDMKATQPLQEHYSKNLKSNFHEPHNNSTNSDRINNAKSKKRVLNSEDIKMPAAFESTGKRLYFRNEAVPSNNHTSFTNVSSGNIHADIFSVPRSMYTNASNGNFFLNLLKKSSSRSLITNNQSITLRALREFPSIPILTTKPVILAENNLTEHSTEKSTAYNFHFSKTNDIHPSITVQSDRVPIVHKDGDTPSTSLDHPVAFNSKTSTSSILSSLLSTPTPYNDVETPLSSGNQDESPSDVFGMELCGHWSSPKHDSQFGRFMIGEI